tara:strand:- start:504 stop:1211 length:708 start_codon:yes stop_codon:yes gene_type:complete
MKINITRRHLEVYVVENSLRTQRRSKEHVIYGDVPVFVKDYLPDNIDLGYSLKYVEKTIPRHLSYGLDSVFIGNFPEFEERQINAFYRDGAIYISNEQDDNEDFIDDVVHEIAHLTEGTYGSLIYSDQKLTREFLGKRQRLFYLLKAEGFDVQPKDFMQVEYSQEFDMFLFEEVGYPLLTQLTIGLFLTPYATTSLSEYFSESFEGYFLRDRKSVKEITPSCYEKIEELRDIEDD